MKQHVLTLLLFIACLVIAPMAWGFQDFTQADYQLAIEKAIAPIKVDGVLDDAHWQQADSITGFFACFPVDTGLAQAQSTVMMTYDDNNLYVGVICHDPIAGDYVVQSLRRDFGFGRSDNFSIYIDPFDDQTNGFTFGITPLGVMREGLIANGNDISTDWDNKWYSQVTNYADRWLIEMRIPFKSFRYNDKLTKWNIKFLRNNLKQNERSCWPPVSRQFRMSSMAFSGALNWVEPPPKAGANVSVIPYVSARGAKNFEENEAAEYELEAGFDAKVAVSSSLNLDITVNPDFSQVEVDRQITNLSRFELFFPERRQFFLENNDLFAFFGFPRTRAFFSRRIGLEAPIYAGFRLSGKVDRNWRVGVLNMQTGSVRNEDETIPSTNYTVGTFQRQVFGRSNIAGIVVNKEATNFDSEDPALADYNRYNRLVGLEYNLLTVDNKWDGDFYYFRTFGPGNDSDAYAHGAFLRRRWRNLSLGWSHELVGDDYNPEVGFAPRTGYYRFNPFVDYNFLPESGKLSRHGPGGSARWFLNDDNQELTDRSFEFSYDLNFVSTSQLNFSYSHNYVKLLDDFDPTNSDDDEAPVLVTGSDYSWHVYRLRYESNRINRFYYQITAQGGGFFNARRLSFSGRATYRLQPLAEISVTFDYNQLRFEAPFEDTNILLVGPRLDFTFTDKIFLTTFVQYNEQSNNLNINTRFQWRFKPVSDLFVVYTDNYFADVLKARSRALIFKLSYWINV